jgi:hypothetical protein
MTEKHNVELVEIYPEMFTWTFRNTEQNKLDKVYNKTLSYLHKNLKFTRKIDYRKQSNPYKYQFGVGDGWFGILKELITGIHQNDAKDNFKWVTKVTQVKEKFGGLRFYVTGTSDKSWKLIHKAEEKSYSVCEVSGSEVEVGQWKLGWVQTLCRKEALKKYYDMVDKNQFTKVTKFEDVWKPTEKSETIVTPKKKH